MPSTFFGLNIARSGMSTYNVWLNTTAHNISNVKTVGYTRQTVNQSASKPISFGTRYGMVGSGTEALDIVSERDVYYDAKYRLSNSDFGKYETFSYYMKGIENSLYVKDSETGGLTNALDNFFKSITSLTTGASDTTKRTKTIGDADMLTHYIKQTANDLQTMQKDVNDQIAKTVDRINSYGQEIASLTKQINTLEIYGTKANDLRDQRAKLLDELSELVDVQVMEKVPAGGEGLTQYIVSIGGAKLVDTNDNYTISYEANGVKHSQNDIDKLYDLKWSNGQDFDVHGEGLGGKLQALFQLRDGNNGEVFSGKATAAAGSDKIVISDVNDMGKSIMKLDLPATDGVIAIGTARYRYESFDVSVDGNGNYTYTFNLKDGVTVGAAANGQKATIGEEVNYRGIPYYMSQLNEFVRTFSYRFNEVQCGGYDMNGDPGKQMFVGKDGVLNADMNFDTIPVNAENKPINFTFSSVIDPTTVKDGKVNTSYYSLTALNTTIDSDILKDGKLLALSDQPKNPDGTAEVENAENLKIMSAMENDKTMFRQGQPGSFLKVLTATVGVDAEKVNTASMNAENIKNAVDNRRLSKAGVDEDEEAQNLIICQNLLNYQYKVLSVMNEALDKLINGTAV